MKIRKVVMLATLIAVISGGELNAQAKTRTLSKITHVKVTKHRVTGYTTKYTHLKLTGLKHHEKASAKANKHGKFVIKVKKNNLKKLNFKIKATKKGYETLTYKYKTVKKTTSNKVKNPMQPEKEHVTVVKPAESPHKSSVSSPSPAKPSTPAKSKAEQIAELRVQLEQAQQQHAKLYFTLKPKMDQYSDVYKQSVAFSNNQTKARVALVKAKISRDQLDPSDTNYPKRNEQVLDAQKSLDQASYDWHTFLDKHRQELTDYSRLQSKINSAENLIWAIASKLDKLQPGMPSEGNNEDLSIYN